MRKLIMSAMLALAMPLASCAALNDAPASAGAIGTVIDATGVEAPAPLAETTIDEKAILVALESADTIATSVDVLIGLKVIVPGTPRALAIKSALIRMRSALTAASAARRAGNAKSYSDLLTNAAIAARDAAKAIKGDPT
jgi:hypothetical protein